MGAPEWLDNAYTFVAKNHDTVTPNIEFKGFSIALSTENLFGEPIAANNCIMRAFEIAEFGDEKTPDVVLSFTFRTPFSTQLWNWLGQYVGEDVWTKFTPGEAEVAQGGEEDGTLLDDGENEETGDLDPDNETEPFNPELDTPVELEYEEPKKSVDPLTVQAPTTPF